MTVRRPRNGGFSMLPPLWRLAALGNRACASIRAPAEIQLLSTGGVSDSTQQVLQERRLGEGLLRMASRRVPGPAAIVLMVPGDGMIVSHLSPGIARLVQGEQHGDTLAPRVLLKVVPLVEAVPGVRQRSRRGVVSVLYPNPRLCRRRVAREVRSHEVSIPGPAVLRVCRCVDSHEAAPIADVGHEGGLLLGVEDVPGGGKEDDDLVAAEVGGGELPRVLGGVEDRKSVV